MSGPRQTRAVGGAVFTQGMDVQFDRVEVYRAEFVPDPAKPEPMYIFELQSGIKEWLIVASGVNVEAIEEQGRTVVRIGPKLKSRNWQYVIVTVALVAAVACVARIAWEVWP